MISRGVIFVLFRTMKTAIICSFLALSTLVLGQNLIPNPGFEEVTGCPGASVFLQNTNHWHRISNHFGTPDQFHADCDYNGLENPMAPGQRPYQGVGYAGHFCYGDGLREYMTVRMCEPMVRDSVYSIEFYVLPAAGYGTMINSYGVHFSGSEPTGAGGSSLAPLKLEEHVGFDKEGFIEDTIHWTKISGNYKAKGGERFATFGNFSDDSETNAYVLKKNCIRSDRSYMLIDGVSNMLASQCEKEKEIAVEKDLQEQFVDRELDVRYEFKTNKSTLELLFWDHLREDGDVIVVYLNDTLLIDKHQISAKKHKLNIELEAGEYLLKMYAVNLGDIPPNTCSIRVSDKRTRRTFILNSDLGKTEAIRIVVE